MLVMDLKRRKKLSVALGLACTRAARGWVVSHHFSIFFYNFQDFYNFFFLQNWCSEKSWIFFKTPTLSVCQIFCRQKFKNLFFSFLDKPLTSILQKSVCKNLENCKSRQENGETLPNLGLPSGKPARGQLIIFFFFLGPLLTYLKE